MAGQSNTNNLPNKILVIDDDPTVCTAIEQGIVKHKVQVVKSSDLESALYHFNQNRFDVVVIEIDFGPLPGLALVQKWRMHAVLDKRSTGFVMLGTGAGRTAGEEGLLKELGDLEMMSKPINPIQLLPMLSRAMASKHKQAAFQDIRQNVIDPLLKKGDFQKAIETVKKMIPDVGERAKRMLIDLYENDGQFQPCLETTLNMLKEENNNINLINTAGRMYMKLGKFAEAKPFLERADNLAPTNLDRLNQMAQMYLQANQPDKSVVIFKELVKLNPETPEYKFDVFKKLYDAGFDEHAVSFGKEVAQPMEIVRHYNNKGVLLAKDHKQDEALLEYERALKFFPKFKENYRIYYNMALAHVARKTKEDYLKAEVFVTKALELDPTFEKAKTTLATLKKALGKT